MIEQNVERVLFYARLGNVEKDYLIKEISLKQCVMEMLARNKQFLIQNGVCVDTEVIPDTVYSDNKWVCFILNQIIFNSIKYRGTEPLVIHIQSQDMGNYVSLSITDNGIGIKPSELCRVFDKGFIGSNGRTEKIQLELVCICAISFVQNWELVLISNRKLEFIQLFCYTSPKAIT